MRSGGAPCLASSSRPLFTPASPASREAASGVACSANSSCRVLSSVAALGASPRSDASACASDAPERASAPPSVYALPSSVTDLLRLPAEAFLLLPPHAVLPPLAAACAAAPESQRWPLTACSKVEAYLCCFLSACRSPRSRTSFDSRSSLSTSSSCPANASASSSSASPSSSTSPYASSLLPSAVVIAHFLVVYRRYLVDTQLLQRLFAGMHAVFSSRVPRSALHHTLSQSVSSLASASSLVSPLDAASPVASEASARVHAPASAVPSASLSSFFSASSPASAPSVRPAASPALTPCAAGACTYPPAVDGVRNAGAGGGRAAVAPERQRARTTRMWQAERAACAFLLLSLQLHCLFPLAAKGGRGRNAPREDPGWELREGEGRVGASASSSLSPLASEEGLRALKKVIDVLSRDLALIAALGGGAHWELCARGFGSRIQRGRETDAQRPGQLAEAGGDAPAPSDGLSPQFPAYSSQPGISHDKEGGTKQTSGALQCVKFQETLRDACVTGAVRLLDRSLGWSRLSVSPALGPAGVQQLQEVGLLLQRCVATSLFSSFFASPVPSSGTLARVRSVSGDREATEKSVPRSSPLSLLSPSSRRLLDTVMPLTLPRIAALRRRLHCLSRVHETDKERRDDDTRNVRVHRAQAPPGTDGSSSRVAAGPPPGFSVSEKKLQAPAPGCPSPHSVGSTNSPFSPLGRDADVREGSSVGNWARFREDESDSQGREPAAKRAEPPEANECRTSDRRRDTQPRAAGETIRRVSDLEALLDAIEGGEADSDALDGVKLTVANALRASSTRLLPTVASACNILVPLSVAGTSVAVECVESRDVFVNAPDMPTLPAKL
ncbi:conserved hypothetical protein [Neospora caninum Liverpool]|nr:conserved hypothetical protein [Neospora caninum Liverpool]CBZ50372.1 conserved hypothetical protein [Neospora caninum Liverpool]|eukprot:XP_003880406.1 conserved hypothetical protein [Neospora caninum Liverpool]